MYIITERHGIFNTNHVSLVSDGKVIYALDGGVKRPVSYDPEDMKLIVDAIKAGKPYVELGGYDGQE